MKTTTTIDLAEIIKDLIDKNLQLESVLKQAADNMLQQIDLNLKQAKKIATLKSALHECEKERKINAKIVVGLYKELDKLKT